MDAQDVIVEPVTHKGVTAICCSGNHVKNNKVVLGFIAELIYRGLK